MLSLIGKSIKVVHFQYRYIVYILKAEVLSLTSGWTYLFELFRKIKQNNLSNQSGLIFKSTFTRSV